MGFPFMMLVGQRRVSSDKDSDRQPRRRLGWSSAYHTACGSELRPPAPMWRMWVWHTCNPGSGGGKRGRGAETACSPLLSGIYFGQSVSFELNEALSKRVKRGAAEGDTSRSSQASTRLSGHTRMRTHGHAHGHTNHTSSVLSAPLRNSQEE